MKFKAYRAWFGPYEDVTVVFPTLKILYSWCEAGNLMPQAVGGLSSGIHYYMLPLIQTKGKRGWKVLKK